MFALRRKAVVKNKPAISQMVHRWPALFTESQVCYEFSRVVGKSLQETFFDELDRFSPRLMDVFRKKKGLTGQLLTELIRQTKTTEPTAIRCLCLRGLPVILADDSSAFFKTCSVDFVVVCVAPISTLNTRSIRYPDRRRTVLGRLTTKPADIFLLKESGIP
ncbi:hypothetical protein DPEC_G00096430 [Dallia pectoralis]|uniref:Uncharacterized protein n=1 Tax=Dallia pectoralis TaxID=75939 RepID=A0ACC2GVZ0_DALPE|nr:hypothetical protein DPEC_G00096430 [Dallia pectoralis]